MRPAPSAPHPPRASGRTSTLIAALTAAFTAACADVRPELVTVSGTCMGTTWKAIAVVGPATPEAVDTPAELTALVQSQLDHVDAKLSTWKPTSDLSRLAAAAPGVPITVAQVTRDVLSLARTLHAETGGAFDPTIGPAVELWGFGATEVEGVAPPSDEDVAAALARVDFDAIVLPAADDPNVDEPILIRTRADVTVDASAVAKGHAVDLAADALTAAGLSAFFLEVGGEVVVRGSKPGGAPWVIGVVDPTSDPTRQLMQAAGHATYYGALELVNTAVATSGDYNNVRELEGGRVVAHAIDPRSARPIEHDLASITVLADRCGRADALATAALVLGPEAGMQLMERLEGVEAIGLVRVDDGLEERRTSGAPEVRRR
ncbi:MAG: FAD:protein FMN transferase [Planctomycetota bacterium]